MRLHVEDTAGAGRPVVLIHGWPLSGAAWEHQVPALRDAGFRVITYDRRGFGESESLGEGFDYDTLTDDLARILKERDLTNVTLVGFSMGGGEVARYVSRHGEERLHSMVFVSAVPPYLMQTDDNPDGPLTREKAEEFKNNLREDREAFFDGFTKDFFSANGELKVSEIKRQKAYSLCALSNQAAALGTMEAWATTDFRGDLDKITRPTLVVHGTADAIVPIQGSGHRTHARVAGSSMIELKGAPHGCNVSHAGAFNNALLDFLKH